MLKILVLAILVLSATGYSMQVFATSGIGVFFDNRSSDNKHLSFTDTNDSEDLTSPRNNTIAGAGESANNTLGNSSQ